jgi:hypothetical protein
MLNWLGEEEAAETLMEAVEGVMGDGIKTKDLGGTSRTVEVTEAVCKMIGRLGPKTIVKKQGPAEGQEINGNGHLARKHPIM